MNDYSADLSNQQGNILKKSKKKKRKNCDPVSCEDPSNVEDCPISEIEVSELLPKAKKSKKMRKSHQDEDTAAPSAEVGEVLPEAKKSKKKRILHHETDTAVHTEEADKVIPEASKIKKKRKDLVEDTIIQSGEGVEVQEEPGEDTVIKKKKSKRNSAKDYIVEGVFEGGVKVNEELIDSLPHKKKKKHMSAQDSCVGEHIVDVSKVEKDPVDITLLKKKKKKKSVSEEGDCDVMITEKEEQVDHTFSKKKETGLTGSLHHGLVQDEGELISQKKKKRKLATDASVDEGVDQAVVEDSQETKRNHCSRDMDKLSENPPFCLENSLQRAKIKEEHKVVINPYVWRRTDPARPARVPHKKSQPKYRTIPPQNVEGWQPMDFKFDNHPMVRHYIPRKIMAMNGIKQQLGEMDEVHLKIPNIVFHGSSLCDIPGYGYGIPD